MTVGKEIRFTERMGLTLTLQITNLFNHFQPQDPDLVSGNNLNLSVPSQFGRITAAAYASRQMEVGARFHF
jgi:hypothetical protein